MKTFFLLAAVALLTALAVAHSDTEQNDLLARDARDASPRRKMKKGSKLKKNKKGSKRMNKKRARKTGRRGKKERKSGRAVDAKCIAQITLGMRRWKDVVTNFKRQAARITDNKKKGGNKATKKGLFAPIANKLLNLGGGNKNALECNGTTIGEAAANLTKLSKDLFDCEKNVNDACNPINFPKPNETLISKCDALVAKFEKEADKCMKLSKDEAKAEEGCACWTADEMKKFTEDVNECKVTEDMSKIKSQLKSCTKAFGKCRNLEDEAIESIYLCYDSKLNQFLFCKNEHFILGTPQPPPKPVKTIDSVETFEEDGIVYQQKTAYNPVTKEATISVPAHLDRKAVSVIIGKDVTTTVSDSSCIIEETARDLDVTSFGSSTKNDTDGIVTQPKPKVYKIYTDLGELSDQEKQSLPQSTLTACKGRSIRNTKIEVVDEATFIKLKAEKGVTSRKIDTTESSSRLVSLDDCPTKGVKTTLL